MAITGILYAPAPEDPHGFLDRELGHSGPVLASHFGELREEHRECLDCDARSYDHRSDDGPGHCSECGDDWPCGGTDGVTREAGARPWNGQQWDTPDSVVLALNGKPLRSGMGHCAGLLLDTEMPGHIGSCAGWGLEDGYWKLFFNGHSVSHHEPSVPRPKGLPQALVPAWALAWHLVQKFGGRAESFEGTM